MSRPAKDTVTAGREEGHALDCACGSDTRAHRCVLVPHLPCGLFHASVKLLFICYSHKLSCLVVLF